MTADFKLLGLL